MPVRSIRLYGDPVLRHRAEEVSQCDDRLHRLVRDMIATMGNAAGLGLAAPQVGVSQRVFVVDVSPMGEEAGKVPDQPMVFINPILEQFSEETVELQEGCLSIPDIQEDIVRPAGVRVVYRDLQGDACILDAVGILARVIQHEFDHLNGVLLIDHLGPFRRGLLHRKLAEIAHGSVEADYPILAA